jgi:hypothetical protein
MLVFETVAKLKRGLCYMLLFFNNYIRCSEAG